MLAASALMLCLALSGCAQTKAVNVIGTRRVLMLDETCGPETLVFSYPGNIPSSDSAMPLRRQIPLLPLTLLAFGCVLFTVLSGGCLGYVAIMPTGVDRTPWIIAMFGCALVSLLCFWVAALGRLEAPVCGNRTGIGFSLERQVENNEYCKSAHECERNYSKRNSRTPVSLEKRLRERAAKIADNLKRRALDLEPELLKAKQRQREIEATPRSPSAASQYLVEFQPRIGINHAAPPQKQTTTAG